MDYSLGGAEWLGTEIVVPGQGLVWLDPLESVTLLYGRNGAGKSTLLNSLRDLVGGRRHDDHEATAFFRVAPEDMFDSRFLAYNFVASTRRFGRYIPKAFPSSREQLAMRDSRLRALLSNVERPRSFNDDELAELEDLIAAFVGAVQGAFGDDAPAAADDVRELMAEWMSLTAASPYESPVWFCRAMLSAAERELFRRSGSWDWLSENAVLFGLDLGSLGFTKDSWQSRKFDQNRALFEWTSMVAVWAIDALVDLRFYLGYDDLDDEIDQDFGPTGLQKLGRTFTERVGSAMNAICYGGVVSMRASGSAAKPEWLLRPALDLRPGGAVSMSGGASTESVRWLASCFGPGGSGDEDVDLFLDFWGGHHDSLVAAAVEDPTRRYHRSPVGSEIPISVFPFALVDLDELFDAEAELGSALRDQLRERQEGSVLFEEVDVVIDVPAIDLAALRMREIGATVARLDLGIDDVRLRTRPEIGAWLEGRPIAIEAHDTASDKWIPFPSLSSAQQTWLRRAMLLTAADADRRSAMVVVDEPEAGIHERAVVAVFDFLSQTGGTVLAATHHPRALTDPRARLLHVERAGDGFIQVRPPSFGGDVKKAADRFGVLPADLLGVKRLMIVVEGSHDRVVVEKLLDLSANGGVSERCLVAEARGVRNVATVADSVVLLNFTPMHVLVVCDNTRAGALNELLEDSRRLIAGGRAPAKVAERDEVKTFEKAASPEERWVLDLLRRATAQGLLDRIHLAGLSTPDMIDQLPPSAFGLSQEWVELRAEHAAFVTEVRRAQGGRGKAPDDFKSWLRETKNAKISTNSVAKAFEALQSLHPDLVALLHEVEVLVAVAAL